MDGAPLMGLAFHSACMVLYPERKLGYDIYKMPDIKPINKDYVIAHEGLYIFGGKNEEN